MKAMNMQKRVAMVATLATGDPENEGAWGVQDTAEAMRFDAAGRAYWTNEPLAFTRASGTVVRIDASWYDSSEEATAVRVWHLDTCRYTVFSVQDVEQVPMTGCYYLANVINRLANNNYDVTCSRAFNLTE